MSTEKIFSILDLYSEKKTHLSVAEISNLLDVPQSSVYRHVRVLKENGFLIETDRGEYQLGYRFIDFANIVRLDNSLSKISLSYMKDLTNDLGETTILSVLSDMYAVCLETVSSMRPVKVSSEQGKIMPLYTGASSKAILAYQSQELVDQLFVKGMVKKYTESTLATREDLVANLNEIQEVGYATSDGEIDEGVISYGVPIRDSKQQVFASLAIAGPRERMLKINKDEIVMKLRNAVTNIEKYL